MLLFGVVQRVGPVERLLGSNARRMHRARPGSQ